MSDADRAIAAGGNPVTVYVTDDGGHTWTPSGASLDEGVRWIGLFGANDGWAAGAAAVHKTSDGGASWTLVKERPGHDDGYTGVQFWSADAMAIADVEDGLIETTDGGVSWTDGTGTFFQGGPRGLAFADEQNGYLLSRDDQDSRFQTRTHLTEDGGTTFRRTVLPLAMGGTSEIVFATSSLGLSLGDRLFVTRDGGASWVPASDRGAASGVAVSASEVWLVGEAGLTHGVGVGD